MSLEQIGSIPPKHQEIINLLVLGEKSDSLVSVPEGSYVQVENEAYAGNFITCPAIVIEGKNGIPSCLHITFDELIASISSGSFESNVDFNKFTSDLKSAKRISVLFTEQQSTGEVRSEEQETLEKAIASITNGADAKINF